MASGRTRFGYLSSQNEPKTIINFPSLNPTHTCTQQKDLRQNTQAVMDRFHELLGAIRISFKLIVTLQEWVNGFDAGRVVIGLRVEG